MIIMFVTILSVDVYYIIIVYFNILGLQKMYHVEYKYLYNINPVTIYTH